MQEDYSLWLMPTRNESKYWRSVIASLAQCFEASVFEPHITLLGTISADFAELDRWANNITSKMAILQLTINRPTTLDSYYRCLFMEIYQSQELHTLRRQAIQHFDYKVEKYYPHMSLLYGQYDQRRKDIVIEELQESNYRKTLHIGRIVVMKISDRVEDWKIAKEYPFGA